MAMKLTQVDVVVLGRFNPFIISPQWLVRQQVVSQPIKPPELKVKIADPQISFQFLLGDLNWQVDLNKLVVASSKLEVNPSLYASKVIEILCHTPVSAVGHNFSFTCEPQEWRGAVPKLIDQVEPDFSSLGKSLNVEWRSTLQLQNECVLSVKVTQSPSLIQVGMNFHHTVSGSDKAIQVLSNQASDLEVGKQLMRIISAEGVIS